MKQYSYRPMALAVATVLGGIWTPAAYAALVVSQTAAFTMSSGTVSDSCGPEINPDCTESNSPPTALSLQNNTNFNQFSASTGILTGVKINLASTRSQTVSGGVTNPQTKLGTDQATIFTASGTSGASISAAGADSQQVSTITHSRSSTPGKNAIAANTIVTSTSATLTVAAASLDAYVGAGTTAVTRKLSDVQATATFVDGTKTKTSSTADYSVTWGGDIAVAYEYLLHALAAFDAAGAQTVLDINFGTHYVGASVADKAFRIFNAIGINGVGLDLDLITGPTSPFGSDLALFGDLTAGGSNLFNISFDTSAAGVFGSTIMLKLSDADVGTASSRFDTHSLRVNLSGTVKDLGTGNQVPEPNTLALVALGLTALVLRRRQLR